MMEAFAAFEEQARMLEEVGELDERTRGLLARQREVAWRAAWRACRQVGAAAIAVEVLPAVRRSARVEPKRVGDMQVGEVGWVDPFAALIEHAERRRGGSLRDVVGTGKVWVDLRATVVDEGDAKHCARVARERDWFVASGPTDRTRLAERTPDLDPNLCPVAWASRREEQPR